MVRAVAGGPVAMAIVPVVARQYPVQGVKDVVIRPGADLDDDQARGRVGDEDRQEAVGCVDVGQEGRARRGQVGDAASAPGTDRELARVYGKMLRSASRIRPRPPIAGADS
jgi:hypothetical protein